MSKINIFSEQRTQHPFFMYDAILMQPEALAVAVRRNEKVIEQLAAKIANYARLFIVGIGTSHHAAQVGEYLMRAYGGGLDVQAFHSFNFALYGPHITSRDCVIGISHRGNKAYTIDALKYASEAGSCTALITGEGEVAKALPVNFSLSTVAQEKSAAHTVSYVSAITVLASLAARIGYHRTGQSLLPPGFLLDELSLVVRAGLAQENEIIFLARQNQNRRRIWIVGGGPSAVTAFEITLKIKETSYLQAEGMSVETMLHGPFQCAEAEDLFILIAPAGAAQQRVLELAGLVKEIGAACLVVSDNADISLKSDMIKWLTVRAVPEPFTALTCLIPLQLFAYYLALERGKNPDSFRLDDSRFARARALIQL